MKRITIAALVAGGLLVAVALAFFVSPEASSKPDGLNKVAIEEGFADQETAHDLEDSPLAGYGVEGVDDDRLSTGLAGVVGVAATFAIGSGLFVLARKTRRTAPQEGAT